MVCVLKGGNGVKLDRRGESVSWGSDKVDVFLKLNLMFWSALEWK